MIRQLELFDKNDNPTLLANIKAKAQEAMAKLSRTPMNNIRREYDNNWLHDNPEMDVYDIPTGILPNYNVPWTSFIHYLTLLISGISETDGYSEMIPLPIVRDAFTKCLWNKDGSHNQAFVETILRCGIDIKIQYEDHDQDAEIAKVYIPNCDEMVIIGKKGSC